MFGYLQGIHYLCNDEMIVFPKSEFDAVSKMEESSRPALYILLGEDENGSAQAYIGESTNGVKRIYNHKSHKLFWNKCLMFVAKDESINKADVQYLERKAIDLPMRLITPASRLPLFHPLLDYVTKLQNISETAKYFSNIFQRIILY